MGTLLLSAIFCAKKSRKILSEIGPPVLNNKNVKRARERERKIKGKGRGQSTHDITSNIHVHTLYFV